MSKQREVFARRTGRPVLVLAVALLSLLGAGLLRFALVESAGLMAECPANPGKSWPCALREGAIVLFNAEAFGLAALGLALATFARPRLATAVPALVATGMGLVLYNTALAALAAAILILSLARAGGGREAPQE